ncbi:hypothetical protein GCM10028822_36720 [Hymenobacter terrigena]
MHTPFLSNRLGRWLAVTLLALLSATSARAQLTGTKAIPGDYSTVAAAISALNAQGVGAGGVTFNVAAGYTETAANLVITATGTAANPIVFQKSGTGANPLITAGVGVSTSVDAVIALAGSDYVTFNGLDVAESAANTTTTTQMEFGYALARASATDGAQFNTIRNCVVTLNKTNTATIGIAGLASTVANTTAVPATSAAGANSGNKIYGNVVTNSLVGIYLAAGSATAVAYYDQNNEIGVTAGNTIGNFGGTASGYGAGGTYQNGLKISGNTLNSTLNYTSATASTAVAASTVTSTLRGIYTPNGTSSNLDITNNTLVLASGATTSQLSGIENSMGGTAASNTVNITGNTLSMSYLTATSATVYGIYNNISPATINISNNTLNATTLSTTGSTYLIYNNHSAAVATISGNQVSGVTRTGASGTMYGYYNNGAGAGTHSLTNNVYNNISVAGSSVFYGLYNTSSSSETELWSGNQITTITAGSTPTGTLYGIYDTYGASGSQFFNNTVTGLSGGSTVYGLNLTNSSLAQAAVYGNTVGGLSTSGASSIYGIYTSVTTPTIYRNKVYGLSGTNAGVTLYGIYTAGGTTITLYNNLVGDLQAPAATGLTAANGLYFSSGTTINAYFNTVYLNASSTGATFGTSGIYFSSTPTTVDLRNNIVVNKSTAAGTGGYTAALRRSTGTAGTVPTNLATTTNNNLYYAGTPSATNLIYVEGTTTATNAQQTLVAYKTFVANRDQAAVTEDVPFLSTTGTAATFLHINPAVATQVESAGAPISSITNDFDNDTRNTTTPDLGADEGTFTPLDLTGPTITLVALGNTSSTANRTLTVTITDASGISTTAPRIFYRKGTSGAFTSALATSVSGNAYTFTLNSTTMGGVGIGDVVQYYVVAQDVPGNIASNPVGGTFSTNPASVYQYTILSALSGVYYVGAGTSPNPARTYATLTAAATAYNTSGLAGAVTFLLLDATYSTAETFPVAFGNNPEASATNTLTIKPNTGITSTISGATSLLAFQNPRFITLDGSNATNGTSRDLTLTTTSTTSGAYHVLVLSPTTNTLGSTNMTIRNLSIVGGSAITSGLFGIVAQGTDNDNLTVQNNSVVGVTTGIQLNGAATVSAGGNDNTVVQGNIVGPATAATATNIGTTALYVGNAVNATVSGNTLQNVTNSSAPFGLSLVGVTGGTVSGNTVRGIVNTGTGGYAYGINVSTASTGLVIDANRISGVVGVGTGGYGGYGIRVSTATANSNLRISNNFISDIQGTSYTTLTSGATVGLLLTSTMSGVNVYYNSVNLTGNYNYAAGFSVAFGVDASVTGLNVQNNIFANAQVNSAGAGNAYSFYSAAPATAYTTLNYNDYYSSGTQATLAYFSSNQTTLAALRTATGKDANSISADPLFASATDLHASAVALNAAATPIAGITTDFDGETRNASTPDIGADEFTPLSFDLAAMALVAPATTSTCYGTAEPVSVSIRNAGTGTLDFSTTPATINVVVTLPSGGTTPLTTTLNTGTLASGATQTVTLPGTLNMSTAGTYSFAVTATVTGDGNTANDLLTPTPTRTVAPPVAGTLAPAASSLCVSGTATLTLTGAANGSIQYQSSTDNVNFTDIANATSATYTTPVLTATTYFRAQVRCNTGTATSNVSTITVNNPLVVSTNTPVAICAGSTATLTATPSAGASVRFFSAATGGTALATAGTYTTPALTANTTYYAEAFNLTGGSEAVGKATSIQTNGGYSGTGTGVVFTTTGPLTLLSTTVYNATATAGSMSVDLVNNTTGAVITTVGPFAIPAGSTTALVPTVLPLNLAVPAAGTYRLVTSSTPTPPTLYRDSGSNTFPYTSPSGQISVTGGYISGASSTYYFFFNIQVSAECVGAAARTAIQVNVTQPATASFPAATASTCGTSAFALTGTVGGSVTTGTYSTSGTGTFSPNATTLNATYTPSAADVAAGTVTITLTSAASGPCAAATATQTLSISPAPVATFSYPTATTYCAGSTSTVSPTLGTGATAGTFSSTSGLSIDATTGVITLSTSTAGTYTVTNTVAASGACAAVSATTTVTITPATTATFAYTTGTFCASGSNPTPTVTGTAGGTFSSTTGLSINATTGTINLSASTLGTYTVTYTVAGACGSSATASVTITAAPVATFSYPTATTYCAGSTSTVSPTLGTGASAGTFSSTTGLSLNAATGVITLSTSTPGTYTVTNTIAASGSCAAATATTTVTITPATTATFAYSGTTFCVSGTNPTPTVTGTSGGTFSSTTGLSINATTGAINLSASTPGTYTVTYTVAGACGSSATASVTITAGQVATFSYGTTSTYCVSGTTAPTVVLGTGATAGTFTSTTGLTLNATTGAITLASSTPGTYTVTNTVAAAGGCAAATATATVTITAAPTATFSYATTAGCAGSTTAVTPTLGTGASAGTFTSTTGLVINAITGAINLATSTAGTYTVTNTVAAAGGCAAATATATFTVNPRPATPTISVVYNGTTTTLTSSATTGNQWYLNGNIITGATGQTYVVNGLPAQYGSYTVTTTNANGCVSLPSTPLVITAARNSIAGASLQVYPNPTPTGQMTLELTGYRLVTQLTVLDALGRVLISELLPANAGTATRTLDLTGVATGVYLLRLRNADGVETRRLVRE